MSGYFTIQELCERWRVSDDTIRREIGDGHLRYLRVRGQIRVPPGSVDEYERRHGMHGRAERHRPERVKTSGATARGTPF